MTKTNLHVDRVDGLDRTAAVLSFGALIFARYVDSTIPLVPLACHRVQKKSDLFTAVNSMRQAFAIWVSNIQHMNSHAVCPWSSLEMAAVSPEWCYIHFPRPDSTAPLGVCSTTSTRSPWRERGRRWGLSRWSSWSWSWWWEFSRRVAGWWFCSFSFWFVKITATVCSTLQHCFWIFIFYCRSMGFRPRKLLILALGLVLAGALLIFLLRWWKIRAEKRKILMRSDTEIEVLPLGEAAKSVPKYWTGHGLSNGYPRGTWRGWNGSETNPHQGFWNVQLQACKVNPSPESISDTDRWLPY